MIKFYDQILDRTECEYIKNSFFNLLNSNDASIDKEDYNTHYVDNVKSIYDLRESLKFVPKIHSRIIRDYGNDYEFNNTFIRIYYNNSYLTHHTDRKDLDITLSINIDSTLDEDWPMYVSNILYNKESWDGLEKKDRYEKDCSPHITKVGDGLAIYGRKHVHWREKLVCREDQYFLQIFYHFKRVRFMGRQVEIKYE